MARAALFLAWATGRMRGEVLRILTAADAWAEPTTRRRCLPSRRPQSGTCTSRSTIYAAGIAAGPMVHQFARWLRSAPLDVDASLNLLAGEFVVAPV